MQAHESEAQVVNLKEMMMILELHRQGLSIRQIARYSGNDRKTVRKYIERGFLAPQYKLRQPRVTLVTPYESYLQQRLG